jgi:hypothetical protein
VLLFKIETSTPLHYNQKSCTSESCQLNQSFIRRVEPKKARDIDFDQPYLGILVPTVTPRPDFLPGEPKSEKSNHTTAFLADGRLASLCSGRCDIYCDRTNFVVSSPRFPVPVNIGQLYNSSYAMFSETELKHLCKNTFQNLVVTQCESSALEAVTRLQC